MCHMSRESVVMCRGPSPGSEGKSGQGLMPGASTKPILIVRFIVAGRVRGTRSRAALLLFRLEFFARR